MRYQHPDLDRAISFLKDFGMVEESKQGSRVYLRGYGSQPFVYIAEQSIDAQRHFLGGFWVVDDRVELQKAASLCQDFTTDSKIYVS